jgi:3D (Asp-Asp-Asp) domain-containing protein
LVFEAILLFYLQQEPKIELFDTFKKSHYYSTQSREMEVSYYSTADDEEMIGDGITASGVKAVEGVTVAMDKSFPFGTLIRIGNHIYECQDRGGAIVGNKVDIFINDREEALRRGRENKIVYILY